MKYTEVGTIAIELSQNEISRDLGTPRGLVALKVRDTGIGMPRKFLESNLYRPFQQANPHSSGTGLGLSIVKRIAEGLHADLNVQSELRKGTTITLKFRAMLGGDGTTIPDSVDDSFKKSLLDFTSKQFFMLSLHDQTEYPHPRTANAVTSSVTSIAAKWFHCTTSSGLSIDADSRPCVCAMSETDIMCLRKADPASLDALLSDVARRRLRLIVLGHSADAISMRSFEGFPVTPILLQQP